jgi:hypothetical protein
MMSATTSAGHGLLENADAIRAHIERKPFSVSHRLSDHPLLQLPRLIELAATLPSSAVEFNYADLPLDQDYLKTPANGLSVLETLHQIENCRSWMVLKNVEKDPAYRQLLLECLEPMRALTEHMTPGMRTPEAFIFVSSPHAVTPYHCDPEHNFLLQMRGGKTMAVFDRDDPVAIAQTDLEAKVVGDHRNLPFSQAMEGRETLFHLSPGTGLHVPMHCPHWVRVGDEVSVSLSITYRSRFSTRREAVLRLNSRLRALGHAPRPPGRDPRVDSAKHFAERVIRRCEHVLRRT